MGAVYFVQAGDGGPIKIGYTSSRVADRVAALQTGNPCRLEIVAVAPGSMEDESRAHAMFAQCRLHGEWFAPGPELMAFIDGIRFAVPPSPSPIAEPSRIDDHAAEYAYLWSLHHRATVLLDEARLYGLPAGAAADAQSLYYALDWFVREGGEPFHRFGADRAAAAHKALARLLADLPRAGEVAP